MATEKPRFSVTMDEDLMKQVEDYKNKSNLKTTSKAITALVQQGLYELFGDGAIDEKIAPSFSDEAISVAVDYMSLDKWGKQVVRSVISDERERMEDDARFLDESSMEQETKIINLFDNPSAAGPALGETGQGCQPYELQ